MEKLTVITPWINQPIDIGSGQFEDDFVPEVSVDYPVEYGVMDLCQDITNAPISNIIPEPNQVAVEVICSTVRADAIEADSKYFVTIREQV